MKHILTKTLVIDQFDSVEMGNINIQMQDLSDRRATTTNDMDIEAKK